MLMLTEAAFIEALYRIALYLIVPLIWALFFIVKARKTNAKLLLYYALGMIAFSISMGLGTLIDFITILMTGHNTDPQLLLYIVWTPSPFGLLLGGYVIAKLLIPEKKWYFLSLILTLNTLYLLDLFIFHWTTDIIDYPAIPGEALVQAHHANPIHPFFTLRWHIFSWSYNVAVGVGLIYKNSGNKSIIRKKYFYLSAHFILLGVTLIFSYLIGALITAIIFCINIVFIYFGLRVEHISEAEITFHREQKICLACKGQIAGFNIFLCPKCGALYHENCARALSSMENACWVCNEPIGKK